MADLEPRRRDHLHPRVVVWNGNFLGAYAVGLGWSILAVIVVAFATCVAAFPNHFDTDKSKRDLNEAWIRVAKDMVQTDRALLPSTERIHKDILSGNPKLIVKEGRGYDWLKTHHIEDGALFIHRTPTRLELLARHGGQGIVELDVEGSQPSRLHTLYVGQANWPVFWWGMTAAGLTWFCLAFLLGLYDDRYDRRRRLERHLLKRTELDRWREVVVDPRFGPASPEERFSCLKPVKQDDQGFCWMRAEQWVWERGGWRREHGSQRAPGTVRVPLSEGLAKATEQWVEFCHQVAAENARHWQSLQAARAAERERKEIERERQRELAEEHARAEELRLALERAQTVAEHLPAADEIMRGLPLESGE